MNTQREAISIIKSFFIGSRKESQTITLVGKPLFSVSPNKVIVQVFYYGNTCTNHELSLLGNALTQCLVKEWNMPDNKSLKLELQAIRLTHSTLDSSIFAQYLTTNAGKYSFNRIFDMLKNSTSIVSSHQRGEESGANYTLDPISYITGIKIKLSGRLTTQRSGPRQTVQSGRIGSSAKGIYGTTDYSQYTNKNKLGAFTMKVWISQQSK